MMLHSERAHLPHKPDGTFAVRDQGLRNQFTISVVFRHKPRHHTIEAHPDRQALLGGNEELPAHGIEEVQCTVHSAQCSTVHSTISHHYSV